MERIELHEIPGFSFGQVQDVAAGTGCTVILCPQGAVTGVDIRGGSPGTRDTAALDPLCNRSVVHAVVLTGGSAFGLDAAGGVMKKLEEEKIGRDVLVTVVPNVCAAVLFDLKFGAMDVRPDGAMGYAACEAALQGGPLQEGNFGAGTGCTVGNSRGKVRHEGRHRLLRLPPGGPDGGGCGRLQRHGRRVGPRPDHRRGQKRRKHRFCQLRGVAHRPRGAAAGCVQREIRGAEHRHRLCCDERRPDQAPDGEARRRGPERHRPRRPPRQRDL